ncbi:transglycosylase SLT domain-containing protein [Ferrovum myxofaciens]|uniref:transglycosylase SLT domain-containing protein n=1 Tax=Ferrovum myxofaciens TaxID=416213 RepID=UPI00068E3AB5|nr:transglycosylase SLT domain-containing protein [Ferrovum myxofaciens]NDU90896.1 transglycosylase SLT domain-containing protein [Ferrovum sp.]
MLIRILGLLALFFWMGPGWAQDPLPSTTPSPTPAFMEEATPQNSDMDDLDLPTDPELPPQASDQAPPGEVWDRIRSGFALPDLTDDRDNQLVAKHIAWFVARPDYVERTLNRSRMYLYFIASEVQRRGMPTEIALLPVVESAYNPHALSRSQASGIWQFIPSTARLFGLHKDWWYDGQKDVVASTYSALDYLQRLYDEFHSWDLALAAYNCGEGKIRREIAYNQARQLPTDFAHLNLSDETRNYVPRLLAAKTIVLSPEHYGLILPPIPDEPYFSSITTHKRIDTKVAAQLAGLSVEDFLMLNPGFNRPLIQLDSHQNTTILVPVSAANSFIARLDDPDIILVSWQTRQLQRGEAIDHVAHEYGMSGEELKRINGIAANRRIASGGVILVPFSKTAETGLPAPPPDLPASPPEAELSTPPTKHPPAHNPQAHKKTSRAHALRGKGHSKPARGSSGKTTTQTSTTRTHPALHKTHGRDRHPTSSPPHSSP